MARPPFAVWRTTRTPASSTAPTAAISGRPNREQPATVKTAPLIASQLVVPARATARAIRNGMLVGVPTPLARPAVAVGCTACPARSKASLAAVSEAATERRRSPRRAAARGFRGRPFGSTSSHRRAACKCRATFAPENLTQQRRLR